MLGTIAGGAPLGGDRLDSQMENDVGESKIVTRQPEGPSARLEQVDLRKVWSREAEGFTPWLAHPDNLDLLGQTLGSTLELEAVEKALGSFRADIVCREEAGSYVLIENQLERTDHDHLGKLLTYAASLEAVTVVWLAATFREEHRAVLDWLNRITPSRHWRLGPARVVLYTPGGGGWGNPLTRSRELVVRDVRDGVVSIAAAARDYGVVIAADGRSVDAQLTAERRG